MATLKEFKALMYDSETVGDISSVVAPHCHTEEQEIIRKNYENHPFNVMRLEYPSSCEGSDNKYVKTAETLKNWIETGIVRVVQEPAIYVYEQEFYEGEQKISIRGITGKVKIEDGVMFPHEETNSMVYGDYKSDRFNLMATTNTVFSSILALYRDENGDVAAAVETKENPDFEFTDNFGVTHRLWAVKNEEALLKIKNAFSEKKLVIADGHVRYETAVNYYKKMRDSVVEYSGDEEFNYVMMNLLPAAPNAPVVRPVHRLLKNKQNFNEEEFITKLQTKFEITKNYIREYDCEKIICRLGENRERRAMALYAGKDYYYLLVPKAEIIENIYTDSQLLHREILSDILNINNENFKTHIAYALTVEDGERKVREGEANCAFYLNPMTSEEIFGLAECGIKMPKRTSCFYPRLMTGIVMNKFDE